VTAKREMTLDEFCARLPENHAARRELAALRQKRDEAVDLAEELIQWSEAYPIDIFPEPDLRRVHELLQSCGMTLDAVSASAMRHVTREVAKMARAFLAKHKEAAPTPPDAPSGSPTPASE
jgi:hypothetical protein